MATIENYVMPLRLYRYRSIKHHLDREIAAIQQAYLYCAGYSDLNDPMEGTFRSTNSVRSDDKYRSVKRAIMDEKSSTGMCSFSEVHNHELMWAHYAERFAGICVAYSLRNLLRNLPPAVSFVRIYYDDKVPVVRHADLEPGKQAKMILSYKNYKWLYEREWRMFGQIGRAHYRDVKCVTHVYLGSKIGPNDKDKIREAMAPLRIPVSDMNVGKYALKFVSGGWPIPFSRR